MKNLQLYNHRVSILFNEYLIKNICLDEFIKALERIQAQIRQEKSNGSLWFKFSQDDALATTIADLEKDLSDKANRDFILERMEEATNLDNELFIHYS